ncbi:MULTISPECIES: glycosyltransferase family 9 protein [unclassified Lentimonas]|uniref:glycosyltransferase family 9 protein n=1 Tax=unclassified Lentimonas TaxID=2630993 RepID=UPI00132B33B9|nr:MULTISPECIES: glycosyltransferase family 9 protein [unclassified Lentimonas]CAA6676967.1 ADP-heptose--lipooligosaccharide heptosyltransferase II (EC [Lentimonas sp. CC4]CAA6686773.1 ADP-heptose--lipooligosaccharide heptosyltransferase II (EC [Lentimonas sp. CC6]CAA7075649.1 ADP-heptose--lipooligosaccharide heptosyltransferase II (EC [Lentimonas sp. CC4]CAA7168192.1 ADP-heptose--lipooligosaccharide heptosyltransferase II (EC [Lentimonas sp. CC21]CAA7181656.1 ADP-heptose--lipooligosaccharide 
MGDSIQRILIIKPSSMGDIIHGLLIAEAIKAQLPNVSIDWVVRREFSELVEAASVIDHTYIFERSAGVGGFMRLMREVRTQRYDAVLDLQGLARTGILTLAAHAKRKLGRSDARECAWIGYNEKTPALPAGQPPHAVKILAAFLPMLGLREELPSSLTFDIPKVSVALQEPVSGGKRVVLFPESRRAEKNWMGYEPLTRWLLEQSNVGQVVWCGHVPFEASEPLEDERLINLTGKTGIDQLPGLLNAADCVVSNDSGPMHLAAALGRPLVTLFGPTAPERFGPYPPVAARQRVIRRADGDMSSITLEEVGEAVCSMLEV